MTKKSSMRKYRGGVSKVEQKFETLADSYVESTIFNLGLSHSYYKWENMEASYTYLKIAIRELEHAIQLKRKYRGASSE